MKIKPIGSGSKGNAIVIETDHGCIMIDCGIPKTKIEMELIKSGVRPDSILAIFLTHSHKDHVQGLPLADKWNIEVYASVGTWKGIDAMTKGRSDIFGVPHVLRNRESVVWGQNFLRVESFRTHHNDYESFGYVVDVGEDYRVSVCLDTGHIDADMIEAMRGSTHIIIEANHDRDMVALSDYPDIVKERNLSDMGHLSNEQAADALREIVTGGEHIYLAHLSSKCNKPHLALHAVKKALLEEGLFCNENYTIEVI